MFKDSSPSRKQPTPDHFLQRLLGTGIVVSLLIGGALWFSGKYISGRDQGSIRFISPKNGHTVWLKSREPVSFEWTGEAEVDSFLEVARDRNFYDLVLEEASPKSPFVTDQLPGDGQYFFRLKQGSADGKKPSQEPNSFTIVSPSPPVLIYPFDQMTFPETKPLRFYWQGKKGVSNYRFQIAFDKNFENLLSDFLLVEVQTVPQTIPAGIFYWRVRGEDNPNAVSLWSEVRVLRPEGVLNKKAALKNIQSEPVPPPPVAVIPETAKPPVVVLPVPAVAGSIAKPQLLRYRTLKKPRNLASLQKALLNPPHLRWGKSKGATSYELQISKNSDFMELVWLKTTSGREAKWIQAAPGKYYWRVQALDKSGNKSSFSTPGSLELKLPPPKLKKIYTYTVKTASPVPISWPEAVAASSYRVLVSTNKKFSSNILDLKVDRSAASLNLEEEGRYFIKVAVLGPEGDLISDYSEPASLLYKKKKVPPIVKTRAVAALEKKPAVDKKPAFPAPQLKLPPNGISIVSLNERQDPILFKWEDTAADVYRLEIAADEGFKKILHSTECNESQVVITKVLPKGKVFWRLQSQKAAQKSDWSPIYSFEFSN